MKSKKFINSKNKKSRKHKRGGFNKKTSAAECNPNDLPIIKDQNELREKYFECCPKNIFGQKNKSPYCKQIDLNWSSIEQANRDITGYYGDEIELNKIKEIMNPSLEREKKKSWWKFWGGKKRKRFSRRNMRK
jgi:hypothetical protein